MCENYKLFCCCNFVAVVAVVAVIGVVAKCVSVFLDGHLMEQGRSIPERRGVASGWTMSRDPMVQGAPTKKQP